MSQDLHPSQPVSAPGSSIVFVDWGLRLGRRTILTDITLTLTGPGTTVVMGPAGTGKSTLLKALAGQLASADQGEGRILLDGQPLAQAAIAPALARQHPRELEYSLLDSLVQAQRGGPLQQSPLQMRQRALELLQHYRQQPLLERLEVRLFDLPRELMRRTQILRAALTGSQVLLIDEPTSDLTADQAQGVLDLIAELARTHTCVVVLHNQIQARAIADSIVLLAGGRVQVHCSTAEFFANPDAHPVLAQFLRTGSCHLPSPDSQAEELDPDLCSPGDGSISGNASDSDSDRAPAADAGPADTAASDDAALPGPVVQDHDTAIAPASLSERLAALRNDSAPPASRGPTGFHWLYPGKLAGCPMPGAMLPLEHDLALLRNVGVTVLINLTEKPMTQSAIPAAGIRTLHMGVEDRNAPPLMWMKLLLVKIERLIEQGEVVAVHCLAGLGRTGTVLACWMVREGLTAEESLRRLRAIEPGFVQSAVQEELLHELELNLLIRAPDR